MITLMKLADAAKALRVAPSTLRHQIRSGRFHARKVDDDWYVTPEEVERYRQEVQRTER
jgi:predicted site-specific integrase-resolvase